MHKWSVYRGHINSMRTREMCKQPRQRPGGIDSHRILNQSLNIQQKELNYAQLPLL